jgi:hypothetical protein
VDTEDWIIHADSDEFHYYGGKSAVNFLEVGGLEAVFVRSFGGGVVADTRIDWIFHTQTCCLCCCALVPFFTRLIHVYRGGHPDSQDMEHKGFNEVRGQYVDRVSDTGALSKLTDEPNLFAQYPLQCQVIKNVANGRDFKTMAYRGYWRTDRGNHQVGLYTSLMHSTHSA